MKYLKKFYLFEGRKERQKKELPIDLSEYSKDNTCQSKCQRKVIHSDDGAKIVCSNCKRIINEIPNFRNYK